MKKLILILMLFSGMVSQAQTWAPMGTGTVQRKIAAGDTTWRTVFGSNVLYQKSSYWNTENLKLYSKNPQSGMSVVNMHYGVMRGKGMTSQETGNTNYTITSSVALGATSINVSDTTGMGSNSKLLAYLGTDGFYYTATMRNHSGLTITLEAPTQAAIATGSNLFSFYGNESHPSVYGYRAIADDIVRNTKNQLRIDNVGQFITPVNGGTISPHNLDNLNNPGSSVVETQSINNSVAGDGVSATFTASETGSHVIRIYMNTVSEDVRVQWTYNGVTTADTINSAEPRSYDIPIWISGDSKTITVSTLATRSSQPNWIINKNSQLFKITGLTPNLNSQRIALFGDSWFVQPGIEARLIETIPNATIINLGVGGNRAIDLINRFYSSVVPSRPDVVILMVGTNDYYGGVSASTFSENINQLKQMVESIGAHLILATSSVGSAQYSTARFNLSRQYASISKIYDQNITSYLSSGVTSLTGTANEVDVSASTGGVTVSLPTTINANTTGNAATVTTNANLTGPITSVGNATSIADATLSIAKTSGLQAALDLKANISNPTFTGTPAAPTATPGANTTQLANTAFVTNALATAGAAFLPLSAGVGFPLTGDLYLNKSEALVHITSSTGTNKATYRLTNGGGSYWIGADNSTGSYFGKGNYAYNIYTDAAVPISFSNAGGERYNISISGSHDFKSGSVITSSTITGSYLVRSLSGSGWVVNQSAASNRGIYWDETNLSWDFYENGLPRYRFKTDGNFTGTSAIYTGSAILSNGSTAVTQTAGDNTTKIATTAFVQTAVSSGTSGKYVPVYANVTNTTTVVSGGDSFYQRVGNIVWVRGFVTFTTVAGSGDGIISVSLPVASNFTTSTDAMGDAPPGASTTTATSAANIVSDASSDKAYIQFKCLLATTNSAFIYSFSYEVK